MNARIHTFIKERIKTFLRSNFHSPDPVGAVLRRTRPNATCILTEPDPTQKP